MKRPLTTAFGPASSVTLNSTLPLTFQVRYSPPLKLLIVCVFSTAPLEPSST